MDSPSELRPEGDELHVDLHFGGFRFEVIRREDWAEAIANYDALFSRTKMPRYQLTMEQNGAALKEEVIARQVPGDAKGGHMVTHRPAVLARTGVCRSCTPLEVPDVMSVNAGNLAVGGNSLTHFLDPIVGEQDTRVVGKDHSLVDRELGDGRAFVEHCLQLDPLLAVETFGLCDLFATFGKGPGDVPPGKVNPYATGQPKPRRRGAGDPPKAYPLCGMSTPFENAGQESGETVMVRIRFHNQLKSGFHGAKVACNARLLAYCQLKGSCWLRRGTSSH